jgi:hypothetical protein
MDEEDDIPKKKKEIQPWQITILIFVLAAFVVFNPQASYSMTRSTAVPPTESPTEEAGFGSLEMTGLEVKGISTIPAKNIQKEDSEERTFGLVMSDGTTLEVKASLLNPREKMIILEPPKDLGPVTQAPEGTNIPRGTIGPPCRPGATFYKTGYTFNWAPGMAWQTAGYHPGFDGKCTDGYAGALADAVVWRVFEDMPLSDWNSVEYWVSGRVYVLTFQCGEDRCFAVYGHLAYPNAGENWPQAGQEVSAGDAIGIIGATGRSFGAHIHLGIAIEKDGQLYWIDPASSGALGTR